MTRVAIHHANILMDCASLGILEEVFSLDYAFQTTDLVWEEVSVPSQKASIQEWIEKNALAIIPLTPKELAIVAERALQHSALSLEDCSIWFLCEQEDAILLTGDAALRKVVAQQGIEIHGILWLLDELVMHRRLETALACLKIHELAQFNKRLPANEISKRVQLWCAAIS
jgi:predicted nucleic acid-binding protein